jgi:hypothetical protein
MEVKKRFQSLLFQIQLVPLQPGGRQVRHHGRDLPKRPCSDAGESAQNTAKVPKIIRSDAGDESAQNNAKVSNMFSACPYSVCVQHDYAPTVNVKLAGRKQESYPRKNWSSMAGGCATS